MIKFSHRRLKEARGTIRVTDIQYLLKTRGVEVTTASIYSWETGQVPKINILAVLAEIYGKPIEYFFEDMGTTRVGCAVSK